MYRDHDTEASFCAVW